MEVLLKIIDELSKDYEDMIPETLVIDLARKHDVEIRKKNSGFLPSTWKSCLWPCACMR